MKALLIMLISLTLALGVSAQRKGYYRVYRPHVYVTPSIGIGLGYGYPYYGYPYYGYSYPPYGYYENGMPYRLSLQIEGIKVDYRNRIREARNDKSLSHAQKKQEIRNLKTERDEAIINAKTNFNRPGTNNRNQQPNNNQNNNYTPAG